MLRELKIVSAAAVTTLALAGGASAAAVSHSFDGESDCAGYFTLGSGFPSCQIFISEDDRIIEISPVIAKYTGGLQVDEINNGLFEQFDGAEITFDNLVSDGDDENILGDWTYDRAVDDPGIRYWAAKSGGGGNSGGGFELFWTVGESFTEAGAACDGTNNFNLACLTAAMVVTEGSWFTPDEKELSHLTFYDSLDPVEVVPLPAAGWMLIAAVGGLGAMRRRQK